MKYEIKVLEPTDLWYVQNNINPETNKFYQPTKNIPFVQQVEINLNNSGLIIQKGALHWCIGKLTWGVYKTDNRLKDMWVSLTTEMDYNAPVYQGTGTVKLEPRQKGHFLHYTPIELLDAQQWEFDDGIFQFCSDNLVIGAKKLKFRQVAASTDKRISKVVQAPGFIRGINPKSKIENRKSSTPAFIRGVASKIENRKSKID